jgi:hypothetical protein
MELDYERKTTIFLAYRILQSIRILDCYETGSYKIEESISLVT